MAPAYDQMAGMNEAMAPAYDLMRRWGEEAGLRNLRQGLVADASGRVLEIGAGTGLNLPHYNGSIESLVLTEPQAPMLRRLQRSAHEHAPQAQVLRAPAEDLPFENDSFDTVVTTLVLCPAGACSSSNTSAPTTPGSPASRTG